MRWLVLESHHMPGNYRLHSEPKWNAFTANEKSWWRVVKVCENRDEANVAIDAIKAEAHARPFGKKAKGRPKR
jgi:hypothetical protein